MDFWSPTAWLMLNIMIFGVNCNMYDVIEPTKLPPTECVHGCAPWASQGTEIDKLWVNGR